MDDNEQMKDPVKMRATVKMKMEFDLMQFNAFWWAVLNILSS